LACSLQKAIEVFDDAHSRVVACAQALRLGEPGLQLEGQDQSQAQLVIRAEEVFDEGFVGGLDGVLVDIGEDA